MNKNKTKKTVAIDFDGVIHAYSKGYQNGELYDTPIKGAFEAIKALMDEGYSVYIHSTRAPRKIKAWLLPHVMVSEYEAEGMGGDPTLWKYTRYGFTVKKIPFWTKFWNEENVLGISQRKIPAMVYVDDRALKFGGDWKNTLAGILQA